MAKDRSSEPITLSTSDVSKMSKVDKLKAGSEGLFWVAGRERHSFASEIDAMSRGEAETIGNEAKELSKFFGVYKQQARGERGKKLDDHFFMARIKAPGGGGFSRDQWVAIDEAADQFADGMLDMFKSGGKVYAIPAAYGAWTCWYDARMFREHGTGPVVRILDLGCGSAMLAVELAARGELRLEEMAGPDYPLEKVNDAFEASATGRGVRPRVVFEENP